MSSSKRLYTWLVSALTGAMIFILACGGAEQPAAPAAPAAPAPAPAAVAAPTPAAPAPAVAVTADAHLKIAQSAEPNSLYSRDRASIQNVVFQKNIYDPLIEIIRDKVSGRLATSWEANSDFTEWTFELREGVKFHNGDPFNAETAKNALDFVRDSDPSLLGANTYGPQNVKEYQVLGEHKLRYIMTRSQPIWPLEESYFYNGLENVAHLQKVSLNTFREAPIATGSYKFVEWVRLEKVELEANKDWWAPEVATMPGKVTIFAIPEPATRQAALLAGEIDWLINPLIPQVSVIEASPNHRIISEEQFDVQIFHINAGRVPALKDRRLRQAISEAIDRETIIKEILGGFANSLRNNLPTTNKLYDPNAPLFPIYDPEHAKELVEQLKADGVYNDEEIELLSPRGVYNEDVRQNQAIAAMVQKVGINMVAGIYDDAIREEKTATGACDWDYQFRLPIDSSGDLAGWWWRNLHPDNAPSTWCNFEEVGPGDWGDPFLNDWIRLGKIAEILPVGPGRDQAWLKALDSFNKSYWRDGLYQLSFVYGVSNDWDFLPEKREWIYLWNFKKR